MIKSRVIKLFHARAGVAAVVSAGAVLVLVVSGCAAVRGNPAADGRPKIGYVVTNTTADFAKELGSGFQAGAALAGGVDSTVVGPRTNDVPKQVELFRELTTTATGGVVVSASSRAMFAGPMADATASGVPVIASAGLPGPGAGVKLLVENDNEHLGRMLADEAISRLPPRTTGKIVLGTNAPAHSSLDDRARGMRDQFARALPGVRVIGPFDTQRDGQSNRAAWELLVAANPDALAFLGTGDIDAINLTDVRTATKGTWLAGGFSVEPHVLQGIKDGHLFAVVSPEHFLKGVSAGWMLAEHAKGAGELPEGWLVTPGLAVTSANVDEVLRRQSSEDTKLAWARPQLDRISSHAPQFLRPLNIGS